MSRTQRNAARPVSIGSTCRQRVFKWYRDTWAVIHAGCAWRSGQPSRALANFFCHVDCARHSELGFPRSRYLAYVGSVIMSDLHEASSIADLMALGNTCTRAHRTLVRNISHSAHTALTETHECTVWCIALPTVYLVARTLRQSMLASHAMA
jgi:hypothetical protein